MLEAQQGSGGSMSKRMIILAAAALCATPALAARESRPATAAAVDPVKQALAARVAASIWPDGTYGRMLDSVFGGKDGLTDMFLDMRPSDLMGALADTMVAEGKPRADVKEGPENSPTFREMFTAEDPHFEERMRITVQVVGEEVRRIAKPIEPKFREGLSKSIARRFTKQQLEPIAAFLETEPGRAFAAQSMTMFIDKDVMLAMVQSVPAMIKELPGAFKKVEAATAHLPKPPKKSFVGTEESPGKEPADDADSDEAGDEANEETSD
jgi:hypothetical protein